MRKEYWIQNDQKDSVWKFIGCGYLDCDRDFSFGPAVRKMYIIHQVLNGKGFYEVSGKRFCLEAGDAFVIRPEDNAMYYADKDDPWTFCWICFSGEKPEAYLENIGVKDGALTVHIKGKGFESSINECLELCVDKKERPSPMFLELCVMKCLYALENSLGMAKERSGRQSVEGAFSFIDFHYAERISVAEISSYLGVDRSWFYRVFKEKTGLSPEQYLINYRLEKAKEFIAGGESFKNAAYLSGIGDVYYFSRLFKKNEGITPSQYREKVFAKTR